MEITKKKQPIKNSGNKFSYRQMIGVYVAICILGFAIIVLVFNKLIQEHDRKLTNDICTLISEKMDTSITYLTTSVNDISTVISCSGSSDMEKSYEKLKLTVPYTNYISIGFVGADGTLYASDYERMEFEKWDLTKTALENDGITISEPYRSSMTGQLVFTMFSPLHNKSEGADLLFVTYPLDELQNLANTKSLRDETEIWIMDGFSDNIIRCSGSDSFLIGSWSNFKLDKTRIKNKTEYSRWETLIRNGEESGVVTYTMDNVTYTQVFKRIDFMPGWNVVVRIPSRLLSDSIQLFRWALIAFVCVIIVATIMLLIFSHNHETAEKKVFENLSNYDPLTQLMNRRYFETSVQKHLQNNGSDCAMMFFDVDYFKEVNDTFGHEAGDKILVDFSALLKEVFGESGLVGRFGGDEFVVLLKNNNMKSIEEMMDRMTAETAQIRVEADPEYRLHFSAGMACYPNDASDYNMLMRCADQALYKVKENGRNGWRRYKTEQTN